MPAGIRSAALTGLEVEQNSGEEKAESVLSVDDRVAEKPLAV